MRPRDGRVRPWGQWRRWVALAETVLVALGGAVCAGVGAAAASEHSSDSGAIMLALVVVLPAMAVAAGLIQVWRTRVGRRARPPSPYDIVAEAEWVLAREEVARVADAALGDLRPELFAYGWGAWRRAGRGAVVRDLRCVPPVRLSYLPRAAHCRRPLPTLQGRVHACWGRLTAISRPTRYWLSSTALSPCALIDSPLPPMRRA